MLDKAEVELYVEPHQMYAEGAHDDKPAEAIIEVTLLDMGYIATDIDIFLDDMQSLWRWTADIAPKGEELPHHLREQAI